MKKYIPLVLFIFIFPLFSFANKNFADYIKADKWWAISDIYKNTQEYYKDNMNKSWEKAVWNISSSLWIKKEDIQAILNWNLTKCSKIFNQLKIDVKEWATKENYQACYNKISNRYTNYMKVSLSNKELKDSLSVENLLTDWNTSNGPYDLLADIQDIWDLLFKDKIKIRVGQIFASHTTTWSVDNDPQYNWLPPYDNNNWYKKNDDNTNNNNNNNWNKWITSNNQAVKNTNNNDNLQLWNICLNQDKNIVNNKSWLDNSNNNNWFWNVNNSNSWTNINFNSFIWENINGWDFDLSLNGLFGWWDQSNNGSHNNKNDLKWALWWWKKECFWIDKILTICIKLVPSWPNGPVWWTVKKNTLEWIIDQTSNTLKDIRQSFIIPAWHADESLWIDFKHVKLADIFAFNIILSKKPVFKFTKDKKAEKEANKADTEACPKVPRKLAALYHNTNVSYCNNKAWDQNKYLITNIKGVNAKNRKPWKFGKPDEKVVSNSSDGAYKEIELYSQYNKNLLKFMGNVNWLTEKQLNASKALKAKSE